MFVNNDIFVFCLSRSSIWAAANTLCRKSWYLCLRIRIHISAKKEMTSIVLIQYTQTLIVLLYPTKAIFSFFKGRRTRVMISQGVDHFQDGRHCLHEPQGGRDLARQMIMPSLQTALHLFCFSRVYCAYLRTVHIGRKGLVKYVSLLQTPSLPPTPCQI